MRKETLEKMSEKILESAEHKEENRNIDTIDAGVPVLSMHAPFETTAKLDCYMTYKAMTALYHS